MATLSLPTFIIIPLGIPAIICIAGTPPGGSRQFMSCLLQANNHLQDRLRPAVSSLLLNLEL